MNKPITLTVFDRYRLHYKTKEASSLDQAFYLTHTGEWIEVLLSGLPDSVLATARKVFHVYVQQEIRVESGLVFRSVHGLRLLVQSGDTFTLVSVKSFSRQYKDKIGFPVGGQAKSAGEMLQYLKSRNYELIGNSNDLWHLINNTGSREEDRCCRCR